MKAKVIKVTDLDKIMGLEVGDEVEVLGGFQTLLVELPDRLSNKGFYNLKLAKRNHYYMKKDNLKLCK